MGILFRAHEEGKIRENMIKEDSIEGIISLPFKIFYATSIHGCILVLNKNKSNERKNKIIFIDASKDYQEGNVRNRLRKDDIEKIVSAFRDFRNIENYCHIADFEEIKGNGFNLNVPKYVECLPDNELGDIQQVIHEVNEIEKKVSESSIRVRKDLKDLGFIVNV